MYHNTIVLLLGTNLGDKKNNLKEVKLLILKEIGEIIFESEIIETKPIGFESNNLFLNQSVTVKTDYSPILVLKIIKSIERKMGRVQDTSEIGYYVDRVIDIDIVFYNRIIYKSDKLTIPHEENLYKRGFLFF